MHKRTPSLTVLCVLISFLHSLNAQDCGGRISYDYDKIEKQKEYRIEVRTFTNRDALTFDFIKSSRYSAPYILIYSSASEVGCYYKTAKIIFLFEDGTDKTYSYAGDLDCGSGISLICSIFKNHISI